MIYYIDGYNLLFSYFSDCEKAEPLECQEINKFIDQINRAHLKVILVFDAYNSPQQISRFDFREVEVVFTAANQKADDYFIEMMHYSKEKEAITFVSNDKRLCKNLRQYRGRTLSIPQFFQIIKQKKKKRNQEKEDKRKFFFMDDDYYHKIFSKKDKKKK